MYKTLILVLMIFGLPGFGQKVTISEDIKLGSDILYDIMGKIDGKILLYRDKGMDRTLQIYDENLWARETVDLDFEKNRIDPVGLVPGKNDFSLFYSFRSKGDQILAIRKFNASGGVIDTATIATTNALLLYDKYYYAHCENRRFVAIFSFIRESGMKVHLFDIKTMKTVWIQSYSFDFPYVRRDFRELIVTDQGGCFIVFEKDEFRLGNPSVFIEAYYLNQFSGQITRQIFPMGDRYLIGYDAKYDNINNKLILAGLFGDRLRNRADGFFLLSGGELKFSYFKESLFEELEKNIKRKVSYLEDYKVVDCIIRADGGVILITELQREFSRRTSIAEGRRNAFSLNAYIDYYNEDMVLISIHPDGTEHWNRVLRKKQFSQDDGALFSSFFVFKSPTELRLIFNDEIKQENTVSEYIINPIGEFERSIVMNTEYQKLKLRFPDAIQISAREFIVPSERNNKFNLVKVTY